jgi:hypothetical protein
MPPSYVLAADIESRVRKGGMRQLFTEIEDVCILFDSRLQATQRRCGKWDRAHHQRSLVR